MTCPNVEKWDLLSMDLLGEAERVELLEHARRCAACRASLGRARGEHVALEQAFAVFDRHHVGCREELVAALPAELPRRGPRLGGAGRVWGVMCRRLSTTPWRVGAILAPAAGILIAVGILLIPGRSAIAFAAVLERMRQARTMVCDFTTVTSTVFEAENRTEERTYHGKLSTYSDGTTQAWRVDQSDPPGTHWTFPDHSVHIDAEGKRTVIRFAEQPNPYARCESPEWWLSRLLKLTEVPDRELGTKTLDGREVVGFEIGGWKLGYGARPTPGADPPTAPTATVRLWVDAGTRLPVRMQVADVMATRMPGILSMKVSQAWEHIEWDVPLDAQAFQPPPPVATAPVEQKSWDTQGPSEEALLDGLRAYAAAIERVTELLPEHLADSPRLREQEQPDDPDGAQARAALGATLEMLKHGYPPQLDHGTILNASIIVPSMVRARVIAARAGSDAAALAQAEEADRQFHEEFADFPRTMQAMLVFYQQLLLEDREPDYFGATVQPGNSDAVLMRWKLDEGSLRVIYGDLRVETVPLGTPPNDAP